MQKAEPLSPEQVIQNLQDWYASPAGEHLYEELQDCLSQVLPGLFGYYAVQVGALSDEADLLQSSRIGQKIYTTQTHPTPVSYTHLTLPTIYSV